MMNYRNTVLALVVVAALLALLSIWIPWPALLVLFFLIVIVPSPFGRQPRQFIERKIEAYRLVSEYERQRRQRPAQHRTNNGARIAWIVSPNAKIRAGISAPNAY